MTRLQQFEFEVNQITQSVIRNSMTDLKKNAVEVCWDLANEGFTSSWTFHNVYGGAISLNEFIKSLNMAKTSKAEATILLVFGERPDWCEDNPSAYGVWKKGVKNIWLKPIL